MTRSEEKVDSGPLSPEDYAKRHQKAFRVAFDFLNAHFPPEDDKDWWEKTAMEASEVYALGGYDFLQMELLVGVCNYLEYEDEKRKLGGIK
jgi:hypothetical protein